MGLLALLSFILFFVFDSFMDILQYRFDQSFFASLDNQFWNPKISWMNKWKDGCPKFGPRFLGSTTVFVFLTDGWHLSKTLMILCFSGAIVSYTPLLGTWLDVVLFYTLFGAVFQLFFGKILIKK